MASIIDKLIRGEIIVQEVGSQDQVILAKRMAVECMNHMLLITIVVIVGSCAVWCKIGLFILVESVRQFDMAVMVPCIPAF